MDSLPTPLRPVPLLKHAVAAGRAPWDVLVGHGDTTTRTSSESGVSSIVLHLMSAAFAGQEAPVIALLLPDGHLQDAQTASTYRMMLERSPLQILLGPSAAAQSRTLTIVAVSGSAAVSLAARALHQSASDERYELALSHDLGTALAVLREIFDLCDMSSRSD